jgi:DNA-binding protein
MTEKDLRDILSTNIRRYRGYRNLSQAEFAEKIDVSIPFLSDIENGKKWISSKTLAKMATALQINAYELLRPDTSLPDDTLSILDKYTADIFKLFEKDVMATKKKYMEQLSTKEDSLSQNT